MKLRTRRTAFWDGVAIGVIKAHAVALLVVAVLGPMLVGEFFGWGWGYASIALTYLAIRIVGWMWSYAQQFDRVVNRETP